MIKHEYNYEFLKLIEKYETFTLFYLEKLQLLFTCIGLQAGSALSNMAATLTQRRKGSKQPSVFVNMSLLSPCVAPPHTLWGKHFSYKLITQVSVSFIATLMCMHACVCKVHVCVQFLFVYFVCVDVQNSIESMRGIDSQSRVLLKSNRGSMDTTL